MPLVMHYWADLQSVHGLCCYGSIMRTQNVCLYMLVLALCLVVFCQVVVVIFVSISTHCLALVSLSE